MCGIAGFFSNNNKFSIADLERMTLSLSHRGPDASHTYLHKNAGLGHARLSIIDLSRTADQPMLSQCGRYVIVYNGEVYNFREIKEEITKQNPEKKFRTSSDTEVIIEAFSLWGNDFVKWLNGMFAIVIYDISEETLHLFRDRIGVKPLYYFLDQGNFAFASELKALLKSAYIRENCSIDPDAINKFLHLGYIPGPHSVFEKIRKFPSGCFGLFKNNELIIKNYWKINDQLTSEVFSDECEAKKRLKELLISSVKYRMISDVPFGTFLSGGIDSSLVTAIACSISDSPVTTFSIGFQDSVFNEAHHAKKVAERLRTDHHEFLVSEKDALDLIPDLPGIFDEPFADDSALPTLLVSKLAGKNVKMVLSGDGGDELFMGYGAYKWAERLNNPLAAMLRLPAAYLFSMGNNRFKRVSELLKYEKNDSLQSHIFSQEQYFFSPKEINTILNPEFYREFNLEEDYKNLKRKLSPSERQSFFDLEYYLKDDLLVKTDRASMRYSLETRVPILDFRIVEFALNLSPELKIRGNIMKYLLKEVLYDYIPEEYFRRPKQGFSMPLGKWLKNDLGHLIDDYLSEEMINKYRFINYETARKIIREFRNGKSYLYNRIWLLIMLHLWLEYNSSVN